MFSHLKFWSHNLHSWCGRIIVSGFSVLFFSQFECKVIQSSHNLVNPSLWILSLRISHIWRFWVLEDLESSAKKYSVKIFSQFLKFSVFRAQFSGSHFCNSQFRSEILTNRVSWELNFHKGNKLSKWKKLLLLHDSPFLSLGGSAIPLSFSTINLALASLWFKRR